jgi:hypothetical protein
LVDSFGEENVKIRRVEMAYKGNIVKIRRVEMAYKGNIGRDENPSKSLAITRAKN